MIDKIQPIDFEHDGDIDILAVRKNGLLVYADLLINSAPEKFKHLKYLSEKLTEKIQRNNLSMLGVFDFDNDTWNELILHDSAGSLYALNLR